MMRFCRSLMLGGAALAWLALAGCEPVPDAMLRPDGGATGRDGAAPSDSGDDRLPPTNFAAPEGLAVAGDYLVVANSRYGFDGAGVVFHEGFATVVDRRTARVVNRIPLAAKNAQVVATGADRVWILCSGQTRFDGAQVIPDGEGALVGIPLAGLATADAPDRVIRLPLDPARPLVGYPSSLAIVGDRAWMGSGTAAALFQADLGAGRLVRGPDNPVLLGAVGDQDTLTVIPGPPGRLIAASFNRDRVWVLDAATGAPIDGLSFEVGVSGSMDGILAAAWRPDGPPNLYLLLGMASRIAAVTFGAGTPQVFGNFAGTGSLPNSLLLDGDRLLILNSGDNNVRAIDAATGIELAFWASLPLSSNPYGMAVGDVAGGGRRLYVTGLMSNAVYVFDAGPGVVPGGQTQEIR